MPKDFQQTVNLREKVKQGERINNVYKDERGNKKDWQRIHRPNSVKLNERLIKRIVILAAVFLVIFSVYWLFFNKKNDTWYAVTLVDGTIWYGQISNISSNPVVMNSVYYNYDQLQAGESDGDISTDKTGNLKLVKMGSEIYGPDGSRSVYQIQIKNLDPLKEDSKVLKAILEYEN